MRPYKRQSAVNFRLSGLNELVAKGGIYSHLRRRD